MTPTPARRLKVGQRIDTDRGPGLIMQASRDPFNADAIYLELELAEDPNACRAHEGGRRMAQAPGRCDLYDYISLCRFDLERIRLGAIRGGTRLNVIDEATR